MIFQHFSNSFQYCSFKLCAAFAFVLVYVTAQRFYKARFVKVLKTVAQFAFCN